MKQRALPKQPANHTGQAILTGLLISAVVVLIAIAVI
jgi:hypothetical protein